MQKTVNYTYRSARRVAVAVVGSTILLAGILMIALPGPAIVVIPIGLAILGVEFAWARLWLRRVRRSISGRTAEGLSERAEGHRERVRRP